MALDSARQLLDELMGRARDVDPDKKDNSISEWNDPRICQFFLVKFCPNQLFTNTKADMGACNKVHDDHIKRMYSEKATAEERANFEDNFIRFCQQTLNDVERRIKRAKQRLHASQGDNVDDSGSFLSEEIQEKMNEMSEKIEQMLEQIEEMGCEGKVEEAQSMMKDVEKLKEQKTAVKRDNMPMHWIQQRAEIGAAQEKQMEVCDVCGAFLIVNDVQQRVDDHLMGKQHVGFGKLKTTLEEILEKRKSERGSDPPDQTRLGRRGWKDNRRSRSKEREDRNGRSRDSHRDRSDFRKREPSPSRRHKERKRSRSGSKGRDEERRSSRDERRRHDRPRGSPSGDRYRRAR
ncbi:Luc7-like protein 3 [Halotydeus destructor]|nr:Luc7-like protein 3 [Halotydeus destructor]